MTKHNISNPLKMCLICIACVLFGYIAVAKPMLRNTPTKLTIEDIVDCVKKHGFFDIELNPKGKFHNNFVDNGNGTITDQSTGLMWEKEGSKKEKTFSRADKYIGSLNKNNFAGYNDWRLPTTEELYTLLEPLQTNGLFIDPIFSNKIKVCWTSDRSLSYLDANNLGLEAVATAGDARRNRKPTIDFHTGHVSEAIATNRSNYYAAHSYIVSSYVRAVRNIE